MKKRGDSSSRRSVGFGQIPFPIYPEFRAGEQNCNIIRNRPYAVMFMYACPNGGMDIVGRSG